MEQVSCCLCGSDRYQVEILGKDQMTKGGTFQVVRCQGCGFHFLNPRPTEEEMRAYYPQNYGPHIKVRSRRNSGIKGQVDRFKRQVRLAILRRYYGCPVEEIGPEEGSRLGAGFRALLLFPVYPFFKNHRRNYNLLPYRGEGKLLDFGCGNGRYLAELREYGWQVFGMDASEQAARFGKEKYDLDIAVGQMPDQDFPPNYFDVVTLWHSLEHLHRPIEVLESIHRVLKPDGLLVVGVPNIGGLVPQWFRECWFGLDPPRHLSFFSERTLEEVLMKTGFRVTRTLYDKRGSGLRGSLEHFYRDTGNQWVKLVTRKYPIRGASYLLAKLKRADIITVYAEKS